MEAPAPSWRWESGRGSHGNWRLAHPEQGPGTLKAQTTNPGERQDSHGTALHSISSCRLCTLSLHLPASPAPEKPQHSGRPRPTSKPHTLGVQVTQKDTHLLEPHTLFWRPLSRGLFPRPSLPMAWWDLGLTGRLRAPEASCLAQGLAVSPESLAPVTPLLFTWKASINVGGTLEPLLLSKQTAPAW